MKNIILLVLVLFAGEMTAQIFGNTDHNANGGYNANQIVWLKVITKVYSVPYIDRAISYCRWSG